VKVIGQLHAQAALDIEKPHMGGTHKLIYVNVYTRELKIELRDLYLP
jgi:hypothetical protein